MLQSRYLLAAGLVFFGAVTRMLPYVLHALGVSDISNPNGMPWNFSPLGAISLFGGAYLADRRLAFAVPLLALFVGDLGMALLMKDISFAFPVIAPITYGSFLLMAWLGTWLGGNLRRLPSFVSRIALVGGTALVGEVLFFFVTNFANWVFQSSIDPNHPPMFPYTLSGLAANYIAAIPFFGKSLTGMALYGVGLFGGYELLQKRAEAPQPAVLADAQ